jgi:hypothetical protein
VIQRDATGRPQLHGLRNANFAAIVPACVANQTQSLPRPTIIGGHGLFGSAAGYFACGRCRSGGPGVPCSNS